MFPNSKDFPAPMIELLRNSSISLFIVGNFFIPVVPIILRKPKAFGAPVPKTPINKNGKPLFPENKIRFSWKRLVSSPAGNSSCPHDLDQPQFGGLVPLGPNSGPVLRTQLF